MNQLLFRSEVKADRETDSAKWISIQAGSDTFEDIGIPRGARREHYEDGSMDEKLSEWQRAVHEFYPPSSNRTSAFKIMFPSHFTSCQSGPRNIL